jgi:hypothetical protein
MRAGTAVDVVGRRPTVERAVGAEAEELVTFQPPSD